jgi:predicted ATPase
MRLSKLEIENFRCYKEPFSISFDDLTAIIGRNDVGKSAIMDALAIFFETASMDTSDASVDGDRQNVRITCTFDNLPASIILDADFHTTLAQEFLLNAEGKLEIIRTFNGSLASPKQTSVRARCLHPTAPQFHDLLRLKRTELIARAAELGIDLTAVNKATNAPIRQAIWRNATDLDLADSFVSLEEEGAKSVWMSLAAALPTYALFKSDRASTDQDSEAQDPLKAAIRNAIKSIQPQLDAIRNHVETEVKKIADATVQKVREMDPSIAETLNPVVGTKKWDSLFTTSITGDTGIPLNKRGSGIKRLVLLNFFRAEAEKQATDKHKASVIYAIEEPETSQHPRNQRMLMSALQDLSGKDGRQVLVTTHTPMLARAVSEASLRFIEKNENGVRNCHPGSEAINHAIAKSLGILPDHNVKAFVGIEGPHDIAFLKAMSRLWRSSDPTVLDLETAELAGEIIFVPLGGSNLALWASRLAHLNRPEIHITDRDNTPPNPPKYADHCAAVNARPGCLALITAKREMENYLHHEAVVEAYAKNGIALELAPFGDFDDVPRSVAEAVYRASGNDWHALPPEKQSERERNVKKLLNGQALGCMTQERLVQSDPNQDTLAWLTSIRDLMIAAEAAIA